MAAEMLLGFSLNGAFVTNSFVTSSNFDVGQIEVLRGPQGAELVRAAVYNVVEWLMKGVAPPAAPIEVADGQIVRDQFGNAKGGVRSAYADVPSVPYIASAPIDEAREVDTWPEGHPKLFAHLPSGKSANQHLHSIISIG
jgi:Alpha/beta hydrolase domain